MTYNPKIMAHAQNPNNIGALDTQSEHVGTGFVGNAACGDMLKIQILVENGIIKDVKSKIFGCGCAIASTSLATEKLKGMTLENAKNLTDKEIAEELGLPAIKLHCSVLAARGVLRAIKNYHEKQDIDVNNTDANTAKLAKNVEMHDISSLNERGEIVQKNIYEDEHFQQKTCRSIEINVCDSDDMSDEMSSIAKNQDSQSSHVSQKMCCRAVEQTAATNHSQQSTSHENVCCKSTVNSKTNCESEKITIGDDDNTHLESCSKNSNTKTGSCCKEYDNAASKCATNISDDEQCSDNVGCCQSKQMNLSDKPATIFVSEKSTNTATPSSTFNLSAFTQLQNSQQSSLSMPFSLTDAAFSRFTQIIHAYPDIAGIRIFSKAGGCAGNEYDIELQTIVNDDDFKYVYVHKSEQADETSSAQYVSENAAQSSKQITFYIPRASMMFLLGLEIDYVTTDVMAQFVFKNKNFKSCGCGSSFRVV